MDLTPTDRPSGPTWAEVVEAYADLTNREVDTVGSLSVVELFGLAQRTQQLGVLDTSAALACLVLVLRAQVPA